MTHTTKASDLITPDQLVTHLADPDWLVVDCRFTLADVSAGRARYRESHIAGAVYAHLNDDLSGPIIPGVTGRHPLPTPDAAALTFGRLGIHAGLQVVAYDDMGGAMGAARLWWMLRWLGHADVAVLDGGWQRWQTGGYPVRSGVETRSSASFVPHANPNMVVTATQIDVMRGNPACRVLDARSTPRFHGREETVDPVAGHIPGAVSTPAADNLTAQGTFRSPDELRTRYESLLGNTPPAQTAVYCGSGVSAAQTVLALRVAGLGEPRLYAGSWSDWITDPVRPIAT